MKRLASVAGLLLLFAAVTTSGSAWGYYLDAPHNESNGITCRTCHRNQAFQSYTGADIDDTAYNAVCLTCHSDTPTDTTHRGPAKAMHSDLAMTGNSNWTTQCVDCHDPHYQPQLDWASTDASKLWLATGTVGSSGTVSGTSNGYADDSNVTTTISFSGVSGQTVNSIDWSNPANWLNKGGLIDGTRAADGSRGLVLVPDTSNPADTYEIVAVDTANSTVTVKGKMSATPGATFGVIYGDNIRSTITVAGALSGVGPTAKTVKFFVPGVLTNDYGGFIDDRATTAPVGLCQVCHPPTVAHWNADNSGDKHNDGVRCTQCHSPTDPAAAFQGGADHTKKIVTFSGNVTPTGGGTAVAVNCNDCHSDVVNAPDSGHLNRGAINLDAGSVAPTSDGTGCGACHSQDTSTLNGDVAITRLGLADANFGTGTYPVDCSGCHPNKPQQVADGTHGGHSSTSFGWDSYCGNCHANNGGGVVKDVHNNNCLNCHDNSSGGSGTTVLGSTTNGVDGDARTAANGGPVTSGSSHTETCTSCHGIGTTNTIADAHHVASPNSYAANGQCTQCHNTSTALAAASVTTHGNPADHSGLIATYSNCSGCHSGNVGTTQGAAVDPTSNKVHDDCVACHNTDTSLKTLAQVDATRVVDMPNPTSAPNDGGGTCFDCHGEYFPNHQNIDHGTSRVTNATGTCDNCHDASPSGNARAAMTSPFTGTGEVHAANGCATCHSADGSLVAPTSLAPGIAAGGGTCETCHLAGTNTWTSIHSNAAGVTHDTRVQLAANCSGCHTSTTPGASAAARDAVTAPFIGTGEVHATNGCATCHDTTTGLNKAAYGLAVAITTGDCETCHISASQTWTSIHDPSVNTGSTVSHSGRVDAVTPCSNCHGNPTPSTSNARDAATAPFTGSGEVHGGSGCATCHNTTNGAILTSGYTKADTISAGDCTTCHTVTSTWESIHTAALGTTQPAVDHNGRVDNNGLCGSCHDTVAGGNAPDAITTPFVGSGEVHNLNGCASCHNTTTGAELTVTAPGGSASIGKGDCQVCHDQYFNAHQHDHSANVAVTTSCANCHAADTASRPSTSQALLATTAPFVGSGEVHGASSCGTCHNTTTDGSLKGSAATATDSNNDGIFECAECHSSQWDSLHSAVAGSVHDISATASCANCHAASQVTGSNARIAATAPYTGSGEVHNDGAGTTCGNCHNVTTGARIAGANGKGDATVSDGGDGVWTCAECHTATWYVLHMNATSDGAASGIDHSGRVDLYSDGTYGSCDNCHTNTAGGASGLMPVSSTDDKVHDACSVCHASDGSLNTGTTTYGGQALAAGTCATCHTATYFDSHVHGQDGGYVNHAVSFQPNGLDGNASTTGDNDTAQSDYQPCSNCHLQTGANTWTGIVDEHNVTTNGSGACATCHNSTRTTDVSTGYSGVSGVIATTTAATCDTCHEDKTPNGSHGGHNASQFGGDSRCTTCHTIPSTGVVEGIHSNNCDLCHTGGTYNATTNGVGPAASADGQVDGDAGLAEGAASAATPFDPAVYTCTTCHDPSGANVDPASYGGIHHDLIQAQNGDCTYCHTAVDHTSMIKDSTTSCVGCHTGTAASAGSNPPVNPNDPKVHDACTTCHTLAAGPSYNGALVSATNNKGVGAMPDGGTIGGTDGGGDCTNCHTAAKMDIHHGSSKAQAGLCETCHDNTNQGATAKLQLACRECHVDPNANGLAVVSLRLSKLTYKPNSLVNANATINNGGHTTTTDGSGYVASHRITGNAPIKVYDYRACFDCHSGNNSTYTWAPVVAPFHGYPGDLSTESIKGGTNRTNIDGTSLSSNLESTADLLPRAIMWYHPGHQKWHRFAAWAYGRGSKNRGTDNKELYKKDIVPSGNNTDNGCSAKRMMQDGARKGCGFSGGEDLNTTAGKNGDLGVLTPFDNKHIQTHAGLNGYNLKFNVPYTNFGPNGGLGNLTNVPYFAAITAPVTVTIQSADYDGSTLTVTATLSSGNCADIGLVYPSGASQVATFSGTGTCTATYSTGTMSLGAKVDAVYNAGSSVDDIGYPVTNNSTPTPANAVNDSMSASVNGTTNLNVMANDSGTGITVTGVTQPAFGTVAIAGGGASVDYTGDGSTTGTTSFTYTITASDSSTSTATVTLTVTANQPPAFGSPTYTASPNATEGSAYTTTTMVGAATDPEGDTITYSDAGTGTCTWTSVATDGTVTGTPPIGSGGTSCTVDVTASATGGSDTATLTINIY